MKVQSDSEGGQMLLEILIAFVIVVIVATAFITLAITSVRNSVFSKNQATATQLATEGIEAMITIRDQNTDNAIRGIPGVGKWTELAAIAGMSCPSDFQTPCDYDFVLGKETFGTPPVEQHYIAQNSAGENVPTAPNDIFTRKIRITGGANVKDVAVFVWWTDSQGLHKSFLTRKLQSGRLE